MTHGTPNPPSLARIPSRLCAFVSIAVLGALARCGGHATPAAAPVDAIDASASAAPSRDAGPPDAADTTANAGDAGEPPDPVITSALDVLAKRLDEQGKTGDGASPLRLEVVERGPDLPWVFALVNTSDRPYQVASDPRLLSFEIKVPGKKKAGRCGFPASMVPNRAERSLQVTLAPGEVLTDRFDPRLYCFDSSGQTHLVPGASVEAHFGWNQKKRFTTKHGRREELPPKPPFVAAALAADQQAAPPSLNEPLPDDADAGTRDATTELVGTAFALGSDYASWSQSGTSGKDERPDSSPLELVMKKGSDAAADRTATISVALHNRSKIKQTVFFRRELVTFEVMGPNGHTTCDPQPDERAPDRQAFTTLAPGATSELTSRLIELCPQGTFSEPGLYLIHGRFDTRQSGAAFGLDAFVGQLISHEPALVRIRTGEQQGLKRQMLRATLEAPGK